MARYLIGRSSPVVRRARREDSASAPRIGFRPYAPHPWRAAWALIQPARSASRLQRHQEQRLDHRALTIRHPGDAAGGVGRHHAPGPRQFQAPDLQPEAGIRRWHDLTARRDTRRRTGHQPQHQRHHPTPCPDSHADCPRPRRPADRAHRPRRRPYTAPLITSTPTPSAHCPSRVSPTG